jgi:hypothetical protein
MSQSIQKKLRIHEGLSITLVNAPANYFETVGELPSGVSIGFSLKKKTGYVHLFVTNKTELEKYFPQVCKILQSEGLLWISFIKKKNNSTTDLTRDTGWECLTQHPMKWITLISFDDNWSAFLLRNVPPEKMTLNEILHNHETNKSEKKLQPKELIIPIDLQQLFLKNKSAQSFFDSLSYTNRKEYVVWVDSAKREETKAERLSKTIEKLKAKKKNPSEK